MLHSPCFCNQLNPMVPFISLRYVTLRLLQYSLVTTMSATTMSVTTIYPVITMPGNYPGLRALLWHFNSYKDSQDISILSISQGYRKNERVLYYTKLHILGIITVRAEDEALEDGGTMLFLP
jgi:hypothetical protein